MMMSFDYSRSEPRQVVVWQDRFGTDSRWVDDLGRAIRDDGVVFSLTDSESDTLGRVESGKLAGAIVVGGRGGMDGLAVMRSIRAIDVDLPCWLVARTVSRPILQSALRLRVSSVFTFPVEVNNFCLALQKVFVGSGIRNNPRKG